MEQHNKLTKTELIFKINKITQEHSELKNKIIDVVNNVEKLTNSVNVMGGELIKLEEEYIKLISELDNCNE